MEILTPDKYGEYDRFVEQHPCGSFMQSSLWRKVKHEWGFEAVLSRNEGGAVRGAIGVLVRRLPILGVSLLYAPRGPVCDPYDTAALDDLLTGVHALAKKHRGYLFKMDPDLLMDDTAFLDIAKHRGFRHTVEGDGFEAIQARFNYRVYLGGRDEDAILASFTQKTRYNIRVALKHGVEVKIEDKSKLDEFVRLMRITGERDGFGTRPRAYFERMLDALGEHARLYLAWYEGQAISGAIAVNYAGKTNYVYGASDNAHRNVMPNYLMQWEMMKWAIETDCTVYDLQGVSGNMDENSPLYGLYRFKRGFGGTLDELAGEFDYVYKPLLAFLIDKAIDFREWLMRLRRRLRGS